MSILGDIVGTYRNPRRAMLRRLAVTNEAKALMTLMGACMLVFVAQWPLVARQALLDPSITFEQRIGAVLMGWVFMAPLLFYAIGGLIWLAVRATGNPPSGLAIRVTLFWSLFAAGPFWLAYGLAEGFMPGTVVTTVLGVFLLVTLFFFVISGISVVLKLRAAP